MPDYGTFLFRLCEVSLRKNFYVGWAGRIVTGCLDNEDMSSISISLALDNLYNINIYIIHKGELHPMITTYPITSSVPKQ
jgi:hypothetical protein